MIWKSYVKYNKPLLEMKDLLILDGESSQKEILQHAISYIEGRKVEHSISLLKQALEDEKKIEVDERKKYDSRACFECGERGHVARDCRKDRKRKREDFHTNEGKKTKLENA